jgi:hypothetical protein
MEYWSDRVLGRLFYKDFFLHYSTTPLLQYSERVRFYKRIEAEGDAPCSLAWLREPAN